MDFWDVAKLMWRRWYVTVPALLLTLAGAIWTGLTVNPDYQVTGHVALVGPAVQRAEGEDSVTRINPWSGEALADAATIRLQGKALSDALAVEGYTGEWSALVAGRLPVIRLEVIAEQPEQAQATLQRLREAVEQEVRDRQAEYNVAPEEQVTTVDYDGGETVEAVTGKVKRALIVVVGAGLILTTGLVIAYDAIARRRQGAAAPPGPPEPAAGAAEAPRARYQFASAAAGAAGGSPAAATVPVAGPPPNGAHGPAPVTRTTRPIRVRYADQPYPEPEYADPAYAEPEYGERHYDQPGYAERRYHEPGYAERRYHEPGYPDRAYHDPDHSDRPERERADHDRADDRADQDQAEDWADHDRGAADRSTGWPASPTAPSGQPVGRPPDDTTIVLPLSGIMSGRSGTARSGPGRPESSTDARTP